MKHDGMILTVEEKSTRR